MPNVVRLRRARDRLDNLVLEEAESLKKKGYGVQEIYDVLEKLHRDLVGDADMEIVGEAVEEFSRYLEK